MNQQSSHRSQGTVQGIKLLLLSRGHTSSKDRLFGEDQTTPEQLLQGAGQPGMEARETSFRKEEAQRSGRNVLLHVLLARVKQQPQPCPAQPWPKAVPAGWGHLLRPQHQSPASRCGACSSGTKEQADGG